nr:MAG TPA: hypothetical protein [Caudoviricetes sp.]
MNINDTIKKMNTANILLDAFGDGHEFTMHDYEELAAAANELFGGRYSEDNPCYGVGWIRDRYDAFGIEKVGSREVEVMTSHYAYERVRYNNTDMYYDKYIGRKCEPKTVKQFIYRMTNAKDCLNVINHCKEEIRFEMDRIEATIERDKQRLETLKKML